MHFRIRSCSRGKNAQHCCQSHAAWLRPTAHCARVCVCVCAPSILPPAGRGSPPSHLCHPRGGGRAVAGIEASLSSTRTLGAGLLSPHLHLVPLSSRAPFPCLLTQRRSEGTPFPPGSAHVFLAPGSEGHGCPDKDSPTPPNPGCSCLPRHRGIRVGGSAGCVHLHTVPPAAPHPAHIRTYVRHGGPPPPPQPRPAGGHPRGTPESEHAGPELCVF